VSGPARRLRPGRPRRTRAGLAAGWFGPRSCASLISHVIVGASGGGPKDDPEVRIRELERSVSDFARSSELTAPTTGTTAGVRGSRTVVLVVAVGLVILAGVVGFVVQHSGGRSSTSRSSSDAGATYPQLLQASVVGQLSHRTRRIFSVPNIARQLALIRNVALVSVR
jgi:hypothetical protein